MTRRPILRGALVGLVYFGVVFAIAFALGTLRVLVLIPRLGETAAVLIELPILLTVSWLVCRWAIARFDVPSAFSVRLVMGVLAFTMLMLVELTGSVIGFGRTLSEHMEQYRTLPGVFGLTGQIAFGTFPLLQSVIGSTRKS